MQSRAAHLRVRVWSGAHVLAALLLLVIVLFVLVPVLQSKGTHAAQHRTTQHRSEVMKVARAVGKTPRSWLSSRHATKLTFSASFLSTRKLSRRAPQPRLLLLLLPASSPPSPSDSLSSSSDACCCSAVDEAAEVLPRCWLAASSFFSRLTKFTRDSAPTSAALLFLVTIPRRHQAGRQTDRQMTRLAGR